MSADSALHGLTCPRCGGMVPIPEGQVLVACPFCELRSIVSGERGVLRYQVPLQVDQARAQQAFTKFLGNLAIARDCARRALIREVFLVHLPFWSVWGRTVGWVFGQKQVGSGEHKRMEPREVKIAEESNWNGAACDVGEFGVGNISLDGRTLAPFDADGLHRSGMVFEPVGSSEQALESARSYFEASVSQKANLDRESQAFVRVLNPRLGLVYYPLWVVRYQYRERSFQVVVDGFTGEVLYGKAPGNSWYRAAVLVGGMALGAVVSVDIGGLVLGFGSRNSDSSVEGALALFVVGLGIMFASYRKFRYGEQYEFRRGGGKFTLPKAGNVDQIFRLLRNFS